MLIKPYLQTSFFFFCLAIILVLSWYLMACGSQDEYDVQVSYLTSDNWFFDLRDVSVSSDYMELVNDRLELIDDCIASHSRPIDKQRLVIKLVPQTYFSPCTPDEEFLEKDAPKEGCEMKDDLPDPSFKKCPCRWRTYKQNDYEIVVPINLGVTTPEQLNLWEIVHVHTQTPYWYLTPEADCIGGCL